MDDPGNEQPATGSASTDPQAVARTVGGRVYGRAHEQRDAYAEASGETVMKLLAQNIRPRDIVTRKALENAAVVVAATGGSTNGGLHLPAIAHEAGIDFDLLDVCEIFKKTPYIADLKPGGKYVAKDMFEAGGMPVLMKTLFDAGFLHGNCMTVTGKTVARILGIHRLHFPVANNLGKDRGGGNCGYPAVTFDHGLGAVAPLRQPIAVDQHQFGL